MTVQVGLRFLAETPEHVLTTECPHCWAIVRDVKLEEHIKRLHPAEPTE